MNGFTVTITPSGGRAGPQTTIQVDTSSGTGRVTELTVNAGGNGLSAQELPVIDLALLVAALAPGTAPAFTPTPAAASAPARQPRGRRTRKAAKAPATPTRGRRAAAKAAEPPTASRGRRRGTATATQTPTASRAYRRMPAQDDVVAVWNESHSATALAAHFDVPRHTAQAWLRRLRTTGVIEPS